MSRARAERDEARPFCELPISYCCVTVRGAENSEVLPAPFLARSCAARTLPAASRASSLAVWVPSERFVPGVKLNLSVFLLYGKVVTGFPSRNSSMLAFAGSVRLSVKAIGRVVA